MTTSGNISGWGLVGGKHTEAENSFLLKKHTDTQKISECLSPEGQMNNLKITSQCKRREHLSKQNRERLLDI